jgi:RHS repeat-associated protein
MTSRSVGGVTRTLEWDVEGHLAAIGEGSTVVQSAAYDPAGARFFRQAGTVSTVWLPDGTRVTDTAGTLSAERPYSFAGMTIAVRTGNSHGDVATLMSDPHGTAHYAVSNAAAAPGTVRAVDVRRETPYGGLRQQQAPNGWPSSKGFVGGENDSATGLVHIGARPYDPALGVFIADDPVVDGMDTRQVNGYAYANANPVTLSDPTGLQYDSTFAPPSSSSTSSGTTDSGTPAHAGPSSGQASRPPSTLPDNVVGEATSAFRSKYTYMGMATDGSAGYFDYVSKNGFQQYTTRGGKAALRWQAVTRAKSLSQPYRGWGDSAADAFRFVGRAKVGVSVGGSVLAFATSAHSRWEEDGADGYSTSAKVARATFEGTTTAAAAYSGAVLGGEIGMTVGSLIPGAGTAVGGVVGAAVGGTIGAIVGSGFADTVCSWF